MLDNEIKVLTKDLEAAVTKLKQDYQSKVDALQVTQKQNVSDIMYKRIDENIGC